MRARNIKPAFFKNEHLAELSSHARLLFIGLWCLADRRGRLEDRPLRIQAELFPFEQIDINPLLNELASSKGGFLSRYDANGQRFVQIHHFEKHQNPHHRETESVIPPYAPASSEKASERLGLASEFPGRALLIPDSPFPNSEQSKSKALPIDWQPSVKVVEWVQKTFPQIDFTHEVAQFTDYHIGKGSQFTDWNAALRTWVRNAARWSTPSASFPHKASKTSSLSPELQEQRSNLLTNLFIRRICDPDEVLETCQCSPHPDWPSLFIYQGKDFRVQEWEAVS